MKRCLSWFKRSLPLRLTIAIAAVPLVTACAIPFASTPTNAFDAQLARKVGADERGMRSYIFVMLKTGPNRVPAGPERDEMFKGHFSNMKRMTEAGHLVLAGPADGVNGLRGLYVFAVPTIEAAQQLVANDPVIIKGEMVAEYHRWYGSASLMLTQDFHSKVAAKPM